MISKIFLLCCVVVCAGGRFEDDCGLEDISSQPQVVGGKRVISREFPWHVAIFYNDGPGDNYKQLCGGSLVRSQLVITAAHCFSMEEYNHTAYLEPRMSGYRVVGGSLYSSWTTENLHGRQQSEVRALRLKETYGANTRNYQDDIAIVHLRTEFIFSPVVRAVCLDLVDRELHDSQTSPGRVGKVAGWGLSESGTVSNRLNFLRVPVVGITQCFLQTPINSRRDVTSDKICAGLTNGSGMCPGDSGGGLVFPLQDTTRDAPRWYLRAVLSNAPRSEDPFNELCQTKYLFLYSNIFSHRTWLSRNMEQLQPQKWCRVRGSVGRCKKFSNCPVAKQDAYHGILPQKCSPSSTKICCVKSRETVETVESVETVETVETCPPLPPSAVSHKKIGSKAHNYCVDPERLYPCQHNGSSWSRGDLCGPRPEKHEPQNWMARLTKAIGSEIQHFGVVGGLGAESFYLISERWLLTRASDWNRLLRSPAREMTPPPEVTFSPRRTVRHPDYIPGETGGIGTNDILLVEMDRPYPISMSYRPVCVYTPFQDANFLRRDVSGRRVPVIRLSREDCRRKFPLGSVGAAGGVTGSHLCVMSINVVCGDDVDNFLIASNVDRAGGCTQMLTGLYLAHTREGHICTELYLFLSEYIPWVERVVWP